MSPTWQSLVYMNNPSSPSSAYGKHSAPATMQCEAPNYNAAKAYFSQFGMVAQDPRIINDKK